MKDYPRIVFFGTPGFAATSLERIVSGGFPVVAVVTAPDKPAGRGLKERQSEVKMTAAAHGIPVLQPVSMKDPSFAEQLASFRPDLQVVIAFRMMPREVWSLPPLGTFNLHASLLPQYRGAAPINRAIMNGETETGVTTFFLNEKIDEGRIIFMEKVPVGNDETAGELHDRLMIAGAELVLRTIESIASGNISGTEQGPLEGKNAVLKQAPKIFKEDCRIDWNRDVREIHNFIRGLSPYPGAFTELLMPDGSRQVLKIYKARPGRETAGHEPGDVLTDGKTFLQVATGNGVIDLITIQLSGRKVLNNEDFLRGFGKVIAETRAI